MTDAPLFQPRITPVSGPAPFNPRSYFLVAFFGGPIGFGVVALMNLARLGPNKDRVRQPTYIALGVLAVAVIGFLLFSPGDWWSPSRNIRLTTQVMAVLASVAISRFHQPLATSMEIRHGEYTSMWKAVGWVLLGGLAQGIITAVIGGIRGVL